MIGRVIAVDLLNATRAVRPRRLLLLVLGAVAAGLICDWLRPVERLVFPRPLPSFTVTPAANEPAGK